MTQRLDKLVADCGFLTRSQARQAILQGRVSVDGAAARRPEEKIDPEKCAVLLDGRLLSGERYAYLMLNKPAGVVSAARDPRQRTVVDLVPPELARKGLFPAGRLDKDTTGFVLLTNDGALAHAILSPKSHIPKTYLARLDGPVTREIQAAFAEGLPLGEDICRPARLTFSEEDPTLAQVILTEGMYHQIKRMFASFGLTVLSLHRSRMGGLSLDEKLKPGQCRPLTEQELLLLQERREL